jgi:hypothetical protein
MKKKLNCWEYKKCGREPGGTRNDLGVCQAATEKKLHGTHGGANAGRACWVVAGTLCGGKVQGVFAKKYENCEKCDFYDRVIEEEGPQYQMSMFLIKKMKEE